MAVLTLTFTGSPEEIVPNIPATVTIEANFPSTIYYTLDGATPTIDSAIYIDPVQLPTYVQSVTLQAFGIAIVDNSEIVSPILIQTFSTDAVQISTARKPETNGITYSRDWIGPDYPIGYDANGQIVSMDIDPEFVDVTATKKGFNGIEPGTIIEVSAPPKGSEGADLDTQLIEFVTTEKAKYFNPYAKYILNDIRLNNEIQFITRPNGSLENIYKEFGGKRIREVADDACYVSGGYVKTFYSGKSNTMVSYYFDHNEARWIKNIQQLPSNIQMPNNIGVQANAGAPLVFPWIPRGRQSGLV